MIKTMMLAAATDAISTIPSSPASPLDVVGEETREGEVLRLTLTMEPVSNVAHQVPASAWLGGNPDDLGY